MLVDASLFRSERVALADACLCSRCGRYAVHRLWVEVGESIRVRYACADPAHWGWAVERVVT